MSEADALARLAAIRAARKDGPIREALVWLKNHCREEDVGHAELALDHLARIDAASKGSP